MLRLQIRYRTPWSVSLCLSLNLTFDVMHTESCYLLGRWKDVIIVADCRNRQLCMCLICWNINRGLEQKHVGFCEVNINLYWGHFYFWFWICLLFQVKHFPLPVVRGQIRQKYQSSWTVVYLLTYQGTETFSPETGAVELWRRMNPFGKAL